jgi:uncharacterized membrane protein
MHDILLNLGVDPARLAKAIFEPSLAALFLACLAHSLHCHGASRTLREFVAGFTLTLLAESTGVLSGAYVYPGFQVYVWATPFVNPASWVALVYVLMEVSNRLVFGPNIIEKESPGRSQTIDESSPFLFGGSLLKTLLVLALVDASMALMIDLVLDPLATIYNWWIWVPLVEGSHTITAGSVVPYNFDNLVWMQTPENPIAQLFAHAFPEGLRYPTRVLGIPLINFIAWLVFVFAYSIQFRWVESRSHWTEARKTWTLWALMLLNWPVLAFLLITPNI